MISKRLNAWYQEYGRDLPWRASGFSAWGILVSEIMLQQTQVDRVIPKLAQWLERWPTPAALAADAPGEAVRAWDRLGYPRRALWLHAAAVQIVDRHGGVVPPGVDDLLALKGVGDYTARAVAVFAYGHRHPVVDTNTRRVIARAVTGQAEASPPSVARDLAEMSALLPADRDHAAVFNAAIMELGATVCIARSPRCEVCPIAKHCAWRLAGYPAHEGPRRVKQKKFEGSDRQVRGIILQHLRNADGAVTLAQLQSLWHDSAQRDRALAGLLADGLMVQAGNPEYYRLP